jgi:O-antigen/teichoic acid export membrane protein
MKRSAVLGFAVGPIGASAFGFISLPASTWMFGAADIGRMAMLQTLTSLAIILFGLGLDQSYLREFHQTHNRFRLFWHATAPGLLLLLGCGGLLVACAPGWVARGIFGLDAPPLAYVALLTITASFCSRYFSLVLRMEERGLAFSMSQVLPKLLFLAALLTIYLAGPVRSFGHLLAAHVVSIVSAMLIFAYNTRRSWGRMPAGSVSDPIALRGLVRYGAPLMVSGLAFWGLEAMDKLLLRTLSDFGQLGNYSVAVGIAAVAGTLSVLFTTIWIPTAYRWAGEPDCVPRIENIANKIIALGVVIILGAGAFSWTLRFILPATYSRVQYLICVAMLPPVLYAAAEVTGIGSGIARKTSGVMIASVIGCAVNLVGNLLLIPALGAAGAAVATALSFLTLYVLRSEASMRSWAPMRRGRLYGPMGALVFLAIAFALTGAQFAAAWVVLWNMLTISFVLWNRYLFTSMLSDLLRNKAHSAAPVSSSPFAEAVEP